jgi:hypothetical protein
MESGFGWNHTSFAVQGVTLAPACPRASRRPTTGPAGHNPQLSRGHIHRFLLPTDLKSWTCWLMITDCSCSHKHVWRVSAPLLLQHEPHVHHVSTCAYAAFIHLCVPNKSAPHHVVVAVTYSSQLNVNVFHIEYHVCTPLSRAHSFHLPQPLPLSAWFGVHELSVLRTGYNRVRQLRLPRPQPQPRLCDAALIR